MTRIQLILEEIGRFLVSKHVRSSMSSADASQTHSNRTVAAMEVEWTLLSVLVSDLITSSRGIR